MRDDYDAALRAAHTHARRWLDTVGDRRVPPSATVTDVAAALAGAMSETGRPAVEVVEELAAAADPGLMAIGSGRFYGWVMGGTLAAPLAADWLVSAWDQNAGLRYATPGVVAVEEAAAAWLLELLGLPARSDVGFVTGATMANFTCLAAARDAVLRRAGWDTAAGGLTGAPALHVLAGAERHDSVDLALRYLGLGAPTLVEADTQGRIRIDALAEALAHVPEGAPLIVCLQAGSVHSGAFDDFAAAVPLARSRGAWVHVDGAFGLWAAAAPDLRHLMRGAAAADSWGTDAHKTLNVPYDCGIAIVADPAAMRAALGVHASYLIADTAGVGDPLDRVPEMSRRARGVPVWAALRALGREGVAELVERLARRARALAEGIAGIDGAEVLNEVCYTQVCVAFESDERTQDVVAAILADGTAWMSGSRWRGRQVMRISVSNWSTDDDDVRRSVDAVRRAAAATTPAAAV